MSTFFEPRLAPPMLRVAGYLLDTLVVLITTFLVYGALASTTTSEGRWLLTPVFLVVMAVYHVGFVAALGGTPPKRAMGFRVLREDGQPLMLDTALLRFLVFGLTMIVPFGPLISFAILQGDGQWRSLHDRIAGTIVVRE